MDITRRALVAGGVGLVAGQWTTTHAAGSATRQWQSALVRVTPSGRLVYRTDEDGNRIPEFGHAGYRNGGRPLPDLPTVHTIGPIDGDNTAHIQAAIDLVGAREVDADGFRGALLLRAGTYKVNGSLALRHSGVVLRGAGDGADPSENTVIRAIGNVPDQRDVLVVGGGGSSDWAGEVAGTRTDITSDVVPVAANAVTVADASRLSVGDNIIIVHPCTAEWLAAVDGGGTDVDDPWEVGSQPIVYNRYVQEIHGNRLTLDVPVFNHLDRSLSQSYLYRWDRSGLVTHVGVESLRVDIAYEGTPDEDEEHARIAIRLRQAEDAWVRDCTMLHFIHAGVETWETTRATVRNCRALDPVSIITGGRRYNFNAYHNSQQILFEDCYASKARHAYVSNGTSTTSGIVFLRGTSESSFASSEGHRRWSQGLLFDNHREVDPQTGITLGIYNRGRYGTGHGWAAAHSVGWNCDVQDTRLVVQRPPTAQNYAIGCAGEITGDGPFEHPEGYIEGANRPGLFPTSLYEAQLAAR